MSTPDTTAVLADAKALGNTALADGKSAGVSLITNLANATEAEVPKFTTDSENMLLEFVPAYLRGFFTDAAGKTISSLEAAAIAGIKTGAAVAITRLEALGA